MSINLEWVGYRTADYDAARQLRQDFLRAPLGLVLGAADDEADALARHCVARDENRFGENSGVIGTVISQPVPTMPSALSAPSTPSARKLRQMIVHPDYQGRGIGRRLVQAVEQDAVRGGATRITLHARLEAVGFYATCGYHPVGDIFEEVGMAHQAMERLL